MKLKNYRTFWILLGIIVSAIPGVNYAVFSIVRTVTSGGKGPGGKCGGPIVNPFGFPDGWHTICYTSSMLFIMQAILIITLTTNEFSFKTHRQNVIDGWSRSAFIGVKLVEVAAVVHSQHAGGTADSAGIWIFRQSRRSASFSLAGEPVSVLLFCTGHFVFDDRVCVRRADQAIRAGNRPIFDLYDRRAGGHGDCNNIFKVTAGQYLPEETTDRLIPFPGIHLMSQAEWEHRIPSYLIAAAIYLIIYCVVTSRYFLKSDL